ncbi:hypothetical protein H0H81_009787 [Sphagnurus paluster]|uniref:Uncharacterized protein n=1 Tax=Sphagnurus paluster TaxID=117069 RepID=A0A9P7FV01_9AGAR|nr:hypothetical protein H0H81_009787 [Sphagnurus paluster]
MDAKAWIFERLVVPELATLDIRCFGLIFETSKLITMVAQSGCALKRLSFPANLREEKYKMDTPARDLLVMLPQVVKLAFNQVTLTAEELQDIGRGILIPRIDVLECAAESPKAYLEMIEMQRGRGGSLVVGCAWMWELSEHFHEFREVFQKLITMNVEWGTRFRMEPHNYVGLVYLSPDEYL